MKLIRCSRCWCIFSINLDRVREVWLRTKLKWPTFFGMEGIPFLTSLDVLICCSLVDALSRRGWDNRASLQGCIICSSTNSSLCMLTKLAYLPIQLQVNLRLLCSTVVLMFKCCCGKTAQENLEFILAHVKFDKLCFPESHNPLTCSFFFHNSTSVYKTTTWFWKKK